MDQYAPLVKHSVGLKKLKAAASATNTLKDVLKTPTSPKKYTPYPRPYVPVKSKPGTPGTWKGDTRVEDLPEPFRKYVGEDGEMTGQPSAKAINKYILSTLSDPNNPIHIKMKPDLLYGHTHAGHQRSDGRRPARYLKDRSARIDKQRTSDAPPSGVLSGVKAYINGYLANTTDYYMRKVVIDAGGTILYSSSGATHILTSDGLNGEKTHKYLKSNARDRVHIVKPEWVFDSIKAGKKLKEWDYNVIKDHTTKYISDMFSVALTSKKNSTAAE